MSLKEWLCGVGISPHQFSRMSDESKKLAKKLYEDTLMPSRRLRMSRLEFDMHLRQIKEEIM